MSRHGFISEEKGLSQQGIDWLRQFLSRLDPGPTRMADPNRVQGARLFTGTLIDRFFLRAELVPVVIQTISVITKNHLHLQKNYHRSGVPQNIYTYTESHLLRHVHFLSNTTNQRSRKQ